MNKELKEKLRKLPTDSGVYVMKDVDGNVIYVGKAKNLKNRVSQYFNKKTSDDSYTFKVKTMVGKIYDFDYYITLSEMDALALENNLIKKYQPFFNILLKDSKTYPYIKIDVKKPYPKAEVVRKVKKDGAKYFGPYSVGIRASEILKIINSAFEIRTCNLKINSEKPAKRECLNYMLGLCSAPCTNRISEEEYAKIIDKVIDFLNGNDNLVINRLQEKMLLNAERENFEKAVELREEIKMIQKLKERIVAEVPQNLEIDVFAYETNNISGAISLIVVRGGKVIGVKNISTIDASLEESEVLTNYIMQYYETEKIPSLIIVDTELDNALELEKMLSTEKKVEIHCAYRGYKKHLIDMAKRNAKEHLEKSTTVEKEKYNRTIGALQNLQKELNLKCLPKRIECYDISNTQGTNSVASMVVFINGEPAKKMYRKFKIKTVVGADDYASHAEVLGRRLDEFEKGEDESFSEKPNLIIIDGGKGQLSSTASVLKQRNYNFEIISLAEKFEEVFLPNNSMPKMLKRASVELRLIQHLRDEAHRFAITYHRNLRTKSMYKNELDNIIGVGEKKKQALMKQFKTLENIKKASVEELALVKGIDKNLAEKIFNYFKNQ